MKAEHTIHFLSELLELTEYLHELVKDQRRLMASDQNGHLLEDPERERDVPF